MVLDALIKIKNEIDPTLTFRRSCREGKKETTKQHARNNLSTRIKKINKWNLWAGLFSSAFVPDFWISLIAYFFRYLRLVCHEHKWRQHTGMSEQNWRQHKQSNQNLPASTHVCGQRSGACKYYKCRKLICKAINNTGAWWHLKGENSMNLYGTFMWILMISTRIWATSMHSTNPSSPTWKRRMKVKKERHSISSRWKTDKSW